MIVTKDWLTCNSGLMYSSIGSVRPYSALLNFFRGFNCSSQLRLPVFN